MSKNVKCTLYLIFLAVLSICSSCEEENSDETALIGTIKSMLDDQAIFPAFLILGDVLLATSDESGDYQITGLTPGEYTLICSAINFDDESIIIEIEEGKIISNNFLMSPGSSLGSVYGELHDQGLYDEQLMTNPSMASWTDEELYDGVSGATIQTMTFGHDLPSAEIYIGDSLLALMDGFGQYWVDLQAGTYPLRVSMPGYRDSTRIIRVEPDSDIYRNFILSQQ